MLSKIFSHRQTSILSAAFVIASMVATSRILGLVRDRMLTGRFTADELGVYFASFRLPNLMFEILIMGSISVAFIPVFTSLLSTKNKSEAYSLAASIINIFFSNFLHSFSSFVYFFAAGVSLNCSWF